MPQPKKYERKVKYIDRAMEKMVLKEGLNPRHAYAKATGIWKTAKKR